MSSTDTDTDTDTDASNYITIPFWLMQPVFLIGLACILLLLCATVYVTGENLWLRYVLSTYSIYARTLGEVHVVFG